MSKGAPLGAITEIWRYPVSSIGGERLTAAEVNESGIAGDREWCLVDAATQSPAAPEKEARWRPALMLTSRLDGVAPSIAFPDGDVFSVTDTVLPRRLEAHFSFPVHVLPISPRDGFGACAEPRYVRSPIHIATNASLKHLAALADRAEMDVRRFRPNVLVETDTQGFVEDKWLERSLCMGTVRLRCVDRAKRCGMTLLAQPDLIEDPEVLRATVRHNQRTLGVYCDVSKTGRVECGDTLTASLHLSA